jgi:hypothetical protein
MSGPREAHGATTQKTTIFNPEELDGQYFIHLALLFNMGSLKENIILEQPTRISWTDQ